MRRPLLVAALVLLAACDGFTCRADHPAAMRARALSDTELETLHTYVAALVQSRDTRPGKLSRPEVVRKLRPIQIRTRGCGPSGEACMKLAGCLDEYIFLYFSSKDGRRRIELEWSDGPNALGRDVLWQREG